MIAKPLILLSEMQDAIKQPLYQTWELTQALLRARYRKTFAGFLWVVINPLLTFTVQCLVFQYVLKIEMKSYPVFLLTGLIPWVFVSQCFEMCTSILVTQGKLIRSAPVPSWVYVASQILDNIVSFLSVFLILLAPAALLGFVKFNQLALIPFALTGLFLGTLGISWILAITQVFFRDTRFIVSFGLQIGFFLTPVFYPIELLPEHLRPWIGLNPIFRMIDPFREILFIGNLNKSILTTCISLVIGVSSICIAALLWRKVKNDLQLLV